MRKIFKIHIIIICICAITLNTYATDLNELQNQKTEVQNKIDENIQELGEVEENLSENLKQIQRIDENISSTEKKLDEINKKITEAENKIKNNEKEIENVNAKYNIQKELLDIRLSSMYETGNSTYLDVVVGAKSISDFISTYYLLSELASYDLELLEQVDKVKKEIVEKSNKIENEKSLLETQKSTAKVMQVTLSNTKLLRENYITKLTEEEKEIQFKIDEYQNEIMQIEQEIRQLSQIITFGDEYKGGPMQWPIYNHYTVTSNYGMRVHPITGVYKLHTGVDISAALGTDFTAIADGIVVKAEMNRAYGNMVIIDHGGGVQTLYAHGSEIFATLGQQIKAGDVVLKVGSTGYSTGPHAHFEVRINGETVNPLDYVKPN